MTLGLVAVFRNRRTGSFLVQGLCAGPIGGSTYQDPPIEYAAEEIEEHVTEAVMAKMRAYREPYNEAQAIYRKSDDDKLRFAREHQHVMVELVAGGGLELTPMYRRGVGYQGLEPVIKVKADEIAKTLPTALRKAFDIVSADETR